MIIAENVKQELVALIENGNTIRSHWDALKNIMPDVKEYQIWYTNSARIVQLFLPERSNEFKSYYKDEKEAKELTLETYKISIFLRGIIPGEVYNHRKQKYIRKFDFMYAVSNCLEMQIGILVSVLENLDTLLFNINESIAYEYEADELKAASIVIRVNIRAAGALAGVIIEKHLKRVLNNKSIALRKSNPGINDLAQALKDNGVIDTSIWRKIGYMADIRNYCDHKKEREPKKEEVQTLLDDTNWLISNIN